ncbi:MAG: cysteine-rich KTR domain-containing protein [Oscillospiraceae bacterium]|nr:cysteine-rich KTR domain-containing protein [Oscillospiraceae bacterium]MCL2278231.1 cysteine-rich KTR domain-containing protein [Oscillospiraceae bacterium]
MDNENECWLLCPICTSKTRIRVRSDTVLVNFALYCPKCKHETIINVENMNMSIVKEPDALMRSQTTQPII